MIVRSFVLLDTVLLTMAMAALGLRTQVGAIREASLRPLLLAALQSAYLMIGGYLFNLGFPRTLARLG